MVTSLQDSKRQADFFSNLPRRHEKRRVKAGVLHKHPARPIASHQKLHPKLATLHRCRMILTVTCSVCGQKLTAQELKHHVC
jgi:transcription elongation factor Elf1